MAKNTAKSQPETVAPESIPADAADVEMEDLLPGEMPDTDSSEDTSVSNATDVDTSADAPTVDSPTGVVGDLANSVLTNAEAQVIEMRDPDSMPKDARMPKRAVTSALDYLQEYDELRVEYVANTSGKDAKAEHYVNSLHPEHEDADGFGHKSKVADLDAQIAELKALRDTAKELLDAHVDAKLSETDDFWDSETADVKYQEIQLLFKATKQARATAAEALENYNKHRKPGTEDLGTVDNYVPQIEKPSGGVAKSGGSGSATRASGESTGRAPQVERAEVKLPGKAGFDHVTRKAGDNVVSNCAVVAQVISADAGVTITREDIQTAWLNTYGTSVENLDKSKVPFDSEFNFDANGKTYEIKLRRKLRAGTIEAMSQA